MEIERRFRLSDREFLDLRQRFDWSSAQRVCDLTLGPSGPTSMQTDGWVVRLRQTGSGTRMEYKSPRNSDWSAWTEYGTSVGSFDEALKILSAIGLKAGLLLDRTRSVAVADGATLSLDDIVGLGRFVEIEVEAERPDDVRALEKIDHLQETLDLNDRQHERPYGEMLLNRIRSEPHFQEEHDDRVRQLVKAGES